MDQKLSNSTVVKIFKTSGLILFEYQQKTFKISKLGLILFSINIFLSSLYYYERLLEIKIEILVNKTVLSSVIFFYAALDPIVNFLSQFFVLISQRRIFKMFKKIEDFDLKLLEISSFNKDKNILFPILFMTDAIFGFYEYGNNYAGFIFDNLLYVPSQFSIFFILKITQQLQNVEITVR
ncbi:hypothetical protein ACKWTF_006541 [Chironomus riparius]